MASEQASVELDAEVARVVFGTIWVKHDYCVINGVREDIETWFMEGFGSPDDPPGGWTWGVTPPKYSRYISEAWKVVEHLAALGMSVSVVYIASAEVQCAWVERPEDLRRLSEEHEIGGPEIAPLVICLTALAAINALAATRGGPSAEDGGS